MGGAFGAPQASTSPFTAGGFGQQQQPQVAKKTNTYLDFLIHHHLPTTTTTTTIATTAHHHHHCHSSRAAVSDCPSRSANPPLSELPLPLLPPLERFLSGEGRQPVEGCSGSNRRRLARPNNLPHQRFRRLDSNNNSRRQVDYLQDTHTISCRIYQRPSSFTHTHMHTNSLIPTHTHTLSPSPIHPYSPSHQERSASLLRGGCLGLNHNNNPLPPPGGYSVRNPQPRLFRLAHRQRRPPMPRFPLVLHKHR